MEPQRLTQVGRALQELGIQMIPAYSPQARGRSERQLRHLAGTPAAGVAAAQITDVEEANRFLREEYIAEFNRNFSVPAGAARAAPF